MKLLCKWLLSACALLALPYLFPQIQVASYSDALIAAMVISLLNLFVRPILIVLTLPVTVISMGLFLFVINAATFWAAGRLLEGFEVSGFSTALLGSIVYSLFAIVIDYALESVFRRPPQQ